MTSDMSQMSSLGAGDSIQRAFWGSSGIIAAQMLSGRTIQTIFTHSCQMIEYISKLFVSRRIWTRLKNGLSILSMEFLN